MSQPFGAAPPPPPPPPPPGAPPLGTPPPPTTPGAAPPRWTRPALVAGAVVLLAGAWILLESAGMQLPPMAHHWPLFLIVGGIASLADWAFVSRRVGAAGRGIFGITLGVDLYFVTAGEVAWHSGRTWGPGVYLALGLGCLAAWAADGRHPLRYLLPGVAAVGLAVTFWGWGRMPLGLFWGALLLLLGGALVAAVVRSRRR